MIASKVDCPSCHSTLKSGKPLPPGVKVKCPQCGKPFTVPAPNGAHGIQPANGRGVHAAPAAPVHAVPATVEPTSGLSADLDAAPRSSGKSALVAALAFGGLLLFLGAGGAMLWYCLPAAQSTSGDASTSDDTAVPPTFTILAVKPRPKPLITLPPDDQAKVDKATERGVAYLKKIQHPDGSWTGAGHSGPDPLGYTGLAGLALIESNVPRDDPAVVKAAAFIRKAAPQSHSTYPLSLAILFLDHHADPADDELIRELGLRLAHAQTPQGGWHYEAPLLNKKVNDDFRKLLDDLAKEKPADLLKKSNAVPAHLRNIAVMQPHDGRPNDFFRGGGDNSNTQFALLAVLAAKRHNLNLDPTLALIAKRFRSSQNSDGSWNYEGHRNAANWPTMTCAGLLGVAIDYALPKDARQVKTRPENDPAIQKALDHVSKHVGEKIQNPKHALPMFRMYYLWCVERVGVLYRLKDIKGKQWYEWGMKNILELQQEDGSWHAADNRDWSTASTCFALLFLQRVDLAEDLTAKLREMADLPVWRDDMPEGEKGNFP